MTDITSRLSCSTLGCMAMSPPYLECRITVIESFMNLTTYNQAARPCNGADTLLGGLGGPPFLPSAQRHVSYLIPHPFSPSPPFVLFRSSLRFFSLPLVIFSPFSLLRLYSLPLPPFPSSQQPSIVYTKLALCWLPTRGGIMITSNPSLPISPLLSAL